MQSGVWHHPKRANRNQKPETRNFKLETLLGRRRDIPATEQAREHALHLPVHRHLAVRREVVDEQRQHPRDRRRGEVWIDAVLLGELLDKLAAEDLLDLVGRDREILPRTNPRLGDMAEAGALELLQQTAQALSGTVVRNERTGEVGEKLRFVAATKDGTEERIEEAHREEEG